MTTLPSSEKTYINITIQISVVVSGDFCRFKLALPSLLSMSKDEVKAAHSDFDRGPRGGGLSFDMDNSDGKASLKRQKSPETTTDTQGMSKFY